MSNMTIAVMMDYLVCHEVEYSERKDPIFAGFDALGVPTTSPLPLLHQNTRTIGV